MGAPTIDQAIRICETIESVIRNNKVIAVHCRAGLGRTGTILAAFLIWEGTSALDALDTVRGVEPRWVQSDDQVVFLEEFAKKMNEDFPGRCTCEVDDAKQNDKVSYV
jgi:atypical dual specificity phosphatase